MSRVYCSGTMSALKLQRPLVVFDLEATGLNSRLDRIVEIGLVKILPDGKQMIHTFRVNPEIPIPPEATAIHGISDRDVAECPTFDELAPKLLALLKDCDLAGFNVLQFDIPLLTEEFLRAQVRFDVSDRKVIDMQRIYHKKEPRDLAAAVRFFCKEELVGAHGAEADALAAAKVLEAQLDRYPDLPREVVELDAFCNPRDPDWADGGGRLKWVKGELTINFGQRRGVPVSTLVRQDPGYLRWIVRSDFPREMQELIRRSLDGETVKPESGAKRPTVGETKHEGGE